VPASHGQTVDHEILGGTARSAAHPVFYLKNKPLTYVPLLDTGGVASTLAVQVNQVLWHEVASLNDLGGDARAYVVHQNAAGRTQVQFGDGEHGARLPSGADNVTATYRVGIGEAGNLPANSLTMLRNRPPGVQAVTNPAPAAGGAGPEGPDQMRQHAPLQVRNMDRLVTLKDYEDFARNFNGIERAQARPVWDGHARRLHLSVAGMGGAALDPHSGIYAALLQAVLGLRAAGAQPVQIDSYERLVFDLKATLVHDPLDAHSPDELATAAVSALAAAFSFAARDFEQPVPASEVIAVLQGVPGVLAVRLEALYLHGQPPAANRVLEALPARLVEGKILPAQILVIDTASPEGTQLAIQEGQVIL
jgi:predicted phage baseplate assembly protein